MKKIMFYSNDINEFKEFYKYVLLLKKDNFEIAFGTYNKDLLSLLSSIKILVVYPDSYVSNITVCMNKKDKNLFKNTYMSLNVFLESHFE